MSRWFNIAGPCKADKHYTLPATSRLPNLSMLIEQESYFVLHAPRQTGKTTAMLALAQQLTATGRYAAVMVSAEVGSAFNHDPGAAELAILGTWRNTIEDNLPPELPGPFHSLKGSQCQVLILAIAINFLGRILISWIEMRIFHHFSPKNHR